MVGARFRPLVTAVVVVIAWLQNSSASTVSSSTSSIATSASTSSATPRPSSTLTSYSSSSTGVSSSATQTTESSSSATCNNLTLKSFATNSSYNLFYKDSKGVLAVFETYADYQQASAELADRMTVSGPVVIGATGYNTSTLSDFRWAIWAKFVDTSVITNSGNVPITVMSCGSKQALALDPKQEGVFYSYDYQNINLPFLCQCKCGGFANYPSTASEWDPHISGLQVTAGTTVAPCFSTTTIGSSSSSSSSVVTSSVSTTTATSSTTTSSIASSSTISSSFSTRGSSSSIASSSSAASASMAASTSTSSTSTSASSSTMSTVTSTQPFDTSTKTVWTWPTVSSSSSTSTTVSTSTGTTSTAAPVTTTSAPFSTSTSASMAVPSSTSTAPSPPSSSSTSSSSAIPTITETSPTSKVTRTSSSSEKAASSVTSSSGITTASATTTDIATVTSADTDSLISPSANTVSSTGMSSAGMTTELPSSRTTTLLPTSSDSSSAARTASTTGTSTDPSPASSTMVSSSIAALSTAATTENPASTSAIQPSSSSAPSSTTLTSSSTSTSTRTSNILTSTSIGASAAPSSTSSSTNSAPNVASSAASSSSNQTTAIFTESSIASPTAPNLSTSFTAIAAAAASSTSVSIGTSTTGLSSPASAGLHPTDQSSIATEAASTPQNLITTPADMTSTNQAAETSVGSTEFTSRMFDTSEFRTIVNTDESQVTTHLYTAAETSLGSTSTETSSKVSSRKVMPVTRRTIAATEDLVMETESVSSTSTMDSVTIQTHLMTDSATEEADPTTIRGVELTADWTKSETEHSETTVTAAKLVSWTESETQTWPTSNPLLTTSAERSRKTAKITRGTIQAIDELIMQTEITKSTAATSTDSPASSISTSEASSIAEDSATEVAVGFADIVSAEPATAMQTKTDQTSIILPDDEQKVATERTTSMVITTGSDVVPAPQTVMVLVPTTYSPGSVTSGTIEQSIGLSTELIEGDIGQSLFQTTPTAVTTGRDGSIGTIQSISTQGTIVGVSRGAQLIQSTTVQIVWPVEAESSAGLTTDGLPSEPSSKQAIVESLTTSVAIEDASAHASPDIVDASDIAAEGRATDSKESTTVSGTTSATDQGSIDQAGETDIIGERLDGRRISVTGTGSTPEKSTTVDGPNAEETRMDAAKTNPAKEGSTGRVEDHQTAGSAAAATTTGENLFGGIDSSLTTSTSTQTPTSDDPLHPVSISSAKTSQGGSLDASTNTVKISDNGSIGFSTSTVSDNGTIGSATSYQNDDSSGRDGEDQNNSGRTDPSVREFPSGSQNFNSPGSRSSSSNISGDTGQPQETFNGTRSTNVKPDLGFTPIPSDPRGKSSESSSTNENQQQPNPDAKETPANENVNATPSDSAKVIDESPLPASPDRSPSVRPIADPGPSATTSAVDRLLSNPSLASSLPPSDLISNDKLDPSQLQSSVDSNVAPNVDLMFSTPNSTIDSSLMELLHKVNYPEQSMDDIARTTSIKAALPFLTSPLSPEIQKQIGIQWSMTFVKCYYARADCLVETDFRWDLTAVFGSCFTFNFNDSAVRMFTHPGPQYGLSLTLYTYQEDFICTTDSTGFKISLQLPTEPPFPETSGIYAMPGVVTSTIVSRVTNLKQDDCNENGDLRDYYYDGTYTVEGCMRSCHQKYAMQQCGCADPRYPKPAEERFCDLNDMLCLENFLACSQDLLTTGQCSCKPVCRETQYHSIVTTSAINFDTAAWLPVCDKYIGPNWNGTCQEYLQKSIAVINLYYDRLSEVVNVEEDAYPNLNFLSDLFAWMGLSFGICFGTVVEIGFIALDVIVAILAKVFRCGHVNLLDQVEPQESSVFD